MNETKTTAKPSTEIYSLMTTKVNLTGAKDEKSEEIELMFISWGQ